MLDYNYFDELVNNNEELKKYDDDNSWWLQEQDILQEYILKFPFKLDVEASKLILKSRLNGAKRLDRVNRIYLESSYNKE